jgi:hypothetical protein
LIDPSIEKRPSERTLKVAAGQDAVTATRFIELAAGCCDPACREALTLAAAELAENIVKYGVEHPDPRAGTISVSVEANVTRLCATNAVISADDAQTVTDIIQRLSVPASNAASLYRDRMRELFEHPAMPRAGLGLLRLAFEGGFHLSASFEAPLLQIVAERTCRDH